MKAINHSGHWPVSSFLASMLTCVMTVLIVLTAGVPNAIATRTIRRPLICEFAPIAGITLDSSFSMRLIVQTGDFPNSHYGDEFRFEIVEQHGLVVDKPLTWTVPATLGVPCTTLFDVSLSGTVDSCRFYLLASCGKPGGLIRRYFVLARDSIEYWTGFPERSFDGNYRPSMKRIDVYEPRSAPEHKRSPLTDSVFPGAIQLETIGRADCPDSVHDTSPTGSAEAEWRHMIETQEPGIGPPEDMDEFSSKWADSVASVGLDHVWNVCFNMADTASKHTVDSILGPGTPMDRPGYFRYRTTTRQLIKLESLKTGSMYHLLDVCPGAGSLPVTRRRI